MTGPPDTPPPPARWLVLRAFASAGLGLLVVGVALAAVLRTETGARGLEDLLARARWGPLILATVLMSQAYLVLGFRWRNLLPRPWPPVLGLSAIQCAGLLLNYALPGPVGEVAVAWFARRRYGVGFADALAGSTASRLVGLVTAGLLAAATWVSSDLPVSGTWAEVIGAATGLIVLGALIGVLLIARPALVGRGVGALLAPIRGEGRLGRLADRIGGGVGQLTDALAGLGERGTGAWLRTAGWCLVGHGAVSAGIWLAAWSLGAEPSVPGVVFTYAASTCGTLVAYAAPGSQVAWDALLVGLLLATAGLGLTDAVAVALVVRLQQVGIMAIGAAALASLYRSVPTG